MVPQPAPDLKGALVSVLAGMDEEARQAMAALMSSYHERQRAALEAVATAEQLWLATLANNGDDGDEHMDIKLPGRVLVSGEEPPAQRAKLGS